MEIRIEEPGVEQRSVAVTMRTPGHDFELAVGFLLTEGLIADRDDVRTVRYCAVPREEQHYNVVSVTVARPLEFEPRSFFATSSCGVCGKASLDAIDVQCAPIADGPVIAPAVVTSLPEALRQAQTVFQIHGGSVAEQGFGLRDVGLRVADVAGTTVDKLVGAQLLEGGCRSRTRS